MELRDHSPQVAVFAGAADSTWGGVAVRNLRPAPEPEPGPGPEPEPPEPRPKPRLPEGVYGEGEGRVSRV